MVFGIEPAAFFRQFELFSVVCIIYVSFKIATLILSRIYVNFIKKGIDLKKTGEWAVITGCTDGIGKSFAFELAKLKMNLVLVSRSREKLEDLANQLRAKYDIKTKVIVINFSETRVMVNQFPEIERNLEGLDIGILINNVGMSVGMTYFVDHKMDELDELIDVNVKSMIGMTLAILPGMVKKRKGVIINVSSMSARTRAAYLTSYAGTKAYMMKFSQDLQLEYEDYGITVQCLTPGFIATKLIDAKKSLDIPSPDVYVRGLMNKIGLESVTTGYFFHDIQVVLNSYVQLVSTLHNTVCL